MLRLLFVIALVLGAVPAQGKVFATLAEAVETKWSGAKLERDQVILTKEQKQRAEKFAGAAVRGVVFCYRVRDTKGKEIACVYLDKHPVRTLPEVLMVAVSGAERVEHLKVLAFAEPLNYLPRSKWRAQFIGKRLSPEMRLNRDIDGVTGATLTCRATTKAVRRVLAVHRVLSEDRQEG